MCKAILGVLLLTIKIGLVLVVVCFVASFWVSVR